MFVEKSKELHVLILRVDYRCHGNLAQFSICPPGQKGSFLGLVTALTLKVIDLPHSNQVIDTVHQIIYHIAKFQGSTPSNGRDITGNLIL
jgi:hypothetical protein